MFKLWCAGKLCPDEELHRFHITCLWCRWRRKAIGKYVEPKERILYTYKSRMRTVKKTEIRLPHNTPIRLPNGETRILPKGTRMVSSNGKPFTFKWNETLRIDIRKYFTMIRCSAIIVLDKIMLITGTGKPLAEVCEFLANYP